MLLTSLTSALTCLVSLAAASHSLDTHASHDRFAKRAAAANYNPPLGLSKNNLMSGKVSIGFLPAYGEPIAPTVASDLNKLLPKPMSIVGTYARISTNDMSMSNLDGQLKDLLTLKGDKPVFNIALGVDSGLKSITPDMANAIAAKMKAINAQGVTVWLRFLWEMNGDWYNWGQQPADFLKAWNLVYKTVHAQTNSTQLLWSPNSLYANDGKVTNPVGGWSPYWPGKQNVDIVGLSFYHYGGWQRNNVPVPSGEAANMIKKFDSYYGSKQRKYVVLSETSASYTYDLKTGKPAPGGASDYTIKTQWFQAVIAASLQRAVPNFRAACFFEIMKDEDAGKGSIVKRLDFRMLATEKIRKKIVSMI